MDEAHALLRRLRHAQGAPRLPAGALLHALKRDCLYRAERAHVLMTLSLPASCRQSMPLRYPGGMSSLPSTAFIPSKSKGLWRRIGSLKSEVASRAPSPVEKAKGM